MKKLMAMVVMVVSMMAMVMPVMATESENTWNSYQKGQLDILSNELEEGFSMDDASFKVYSVDGYKIMTGSCRFVTEHYYIRVYYSESNQKGYGSVYFKDGTYIASFNNTNEIDSLVF